MKAEVILENSTRAKEAIQALEQNGVNKSSISVSSPSRVQIERLLRIQGGGERDISLNTTSTVLSVSLVFAVLGLAAILMTNSETTLLVEAAVVILAASVGGFLSLIVSLFKFSRFRDYKAVEITNGSIISDKVALEFDVNESAKREIESSLSFHAPLAVTFRS